MESTMEATTSMTTPPEEVDNLIQMVAEQAGLDLGGQLDNAGEVGTKVPEKKGNI
jgi:charged multivesicular body protein 1